MADWHNTYIATALAKAGQLLPANGAQGVKASGVPAIATTQLKSQAAVIKTICPQGGEALHKVPSPSTKLKANHFLKCGAVGGGTVMF